MMTKEDDEWREEPFALPDEGDRRSIDEERYVGRDHHEAQSPDEWTVVAEGESPGLLSPGAKKEKEAV
ncbi:hypothetical protein JCM8097_007349 [Rhodosporidiobolus ruineniae]